MRRFVDHVMPTRLHPPPGGLITIMNTPRMWPAAKRVTRGMADPRRRARGRPHKRAGAGGGPSLVPPSRGDELPDAPGLIAARACDPRRIGRNGKHAAAAAAAATAAARAQGGAAAGTLRGPARAAAAWRRGRRARRRPHAARDLPAHPEDRRHHLQQGRALPQGQALRWGRRAAAAAAGATPLADVCAACARFLAGISFAQFETTQGNEQCLSSFDTEGKTLLMLVRAMRRPNTHGARAATTGACLQRLLIGAR
eukprot:scaffold834_cov311-Prasinococcus_capsulatus_cf.AAC.9